MRFKRYHFLLTDELQEKCSILYGKGDDRMDVEFVRKRITQLRLQKDVSEYKMSYDSGHSRGLHKQYLFRENAALHDRVLRHL